MTEVQTEVTIDHAKSAIRASVDHAMREASQVLRRPRRDAGPDAPSLANLQDERAKRASVSLSWLVNTAPIRYADFGLDTATRDTLREVVSLLSEGTGATELAQARMDAVRGKLAEALEHLEERMGDLVQLREREEKRKEERFKRNGDRGRRIERAAALRIDLLDIRDNLGLGDKGTPNYVPLSAGELDITDRCIEEMVARQFPPEVIKELRDAREQIAQKRLHRAWVHAFTTIEKWPDPTEETP